MDRNVLRTFINCFVNVNFYTIRSDEMKGTIRGGWNFNKDPWCLKICSFNHFGILQVSFCFYDKRSNDPEIENCWILVSSKFLPFEYLEKKDMITSIRRKNTKTRISYLLYTESRLSSSKRKNSITDYLIRFRRSLLVRAIRKNEHRLSLARREERLWTRCSKNRTF